MLAALLRTPPVSKRVNGILVVRQGDQCPTGELECSDGAHEIFLANWLADIVYTGSGCCPVGSVFPCSGYSLV